MTDRFRKPAVLSALLSILGIAVSVELTRIHVFVHTDPSYRSICAVNEGINCETVAVSPYSVFAGLPLSVWGIGGYLMTGVLSIWALSSRRLHSAWPCGLMLMITSGFVGVSLILAYLSVTKIDSLCLFCLGSYIINLLLFIVCITAVATSGVKASTFVLIDFMALAVRPKLTAAVVLIVVTAAVTAKVLIPVYWKMSAWEQLPIGESGVDDSGSHWVGAAKPRVTFVEFSDYECPHCKDAHKNIRLFVASHSDEVRLVHRHLPLDASCHPKLTTPFHKRACEFAEAAECAGMQGKFWEMNDALFSSQNRGNGGQVELMDVVVRLGLDRSAFKQCMAGHLASERIMTDILDALKLGLKGTPAVIVDGRIYLGGISNVEMGKILSNTRRQSETDGA